MKKKRPVIIVIIVLALLLLGYTLLFGDKKQTDDTPSAASLEIEILEYPETIETSCDQIEIKIAITNDGEIPVRYSDITSGVYHFVVHVENIQAWSSEREILISDFGSVEVGETKEVTFTGGEFYEYSGGIYHENNFRGPDENGTYKMKVSFTDPGEDGTFTVRGESEFVDLTMNIYEDASRNLLKSCGGV